LAFLFHGDFNVKIFSSPFFLLRNFARQNMAKTEWRLGNILPVAALTSPFYLLRLWSEKSLCDVDVWTIFLSTIFRFILSKSIALSSLQLFQIFIWMACMWSLLNRLNILLHCFMFPKGWQWHSGARENVKYEAKRLKGTYTHAANTAANKPFGLVQVSSLLSFHMTQLLNRNITDGHCAIRKPIVSGNQNKWNHNGKIAN